MTHQQMKAKLEKDGWTFNFSQQNAKDGNNMFKVPVIAKKENKTVSGNNFSEVVKKIKLLN